MNEFDALLGNGLRELAERLTAAGDYEWQVIALEANTVFRADRASALRAKAKREALPLEIRAHAPNVELRLAPA